MEMCAPQLPGKYCSFFRFKTSDGQRFGQKVWADILVEEAQEEIFQSFVNPVNQSIDVHRSSSLLKESQELKFEQMMREDAEAQMKEMEALIAQEKEVAE